MITDKYEGKSSANNKPGDHICLIYKNSDEQFSVLASFFKEGFENSQKCIYVVDENDKQEAVSELIKRGIDIKKMTEAGQFEILTTGETYLKDGYFNPDKMILLLKEAEKKTLEQGYSGLRVTGEPKWALGDAAVSEKLIEYESKVNGIFPHSKIIGLCQYNEICCKHSILVEAIHTHPSVMFDENLYENPNYFSTDAHIGGKHSYLPPDSYELIKEDLMNPTD